MALGSTQPLTEMSTRSISWGGKGGRCVGLTTLPPSCADCLEILGASSSGSLKSLSRHVMWLLYFYRYLNIAISSFGTKRLGNLDRTVWQGWVPSRDIRLIARLNLMIERSADTNGTNQLNKYLYMEQIPSEKWPLFTLRFICSLCNPGRSLPCSQQPPVVLGLTNINPVHRVTHYDPFVIFTFHLCLGLQRTLRSRPREDQSVNV